MYLLQGKKAGWTFFKQGEEGFFFFCRGLYNPQNNWNFKYTTDGEPQVGDLYIRVRLFYHFIW